MGQPRVEEAFVGTGTAADILGMPPGNTAKMLARHGVEKQTVRLGKREMAIYVKSDVERVRQKREADVSRRAADSKRRMAARANASRKRIAA